MLVQNVELFPGKATRVTDKNWGPGGARWLLWRDNFLCLLSILFLLTVLTVPSGCAPQPDYKKVKLSSGDQSSSPSSAERPKAPLRVAIAAVISPKETFKSYEDFLRYLSKKLDRPVELVQRQTYAEINDLVRSGNVDLALICGGAYIEGRRDFGMEAIAAPQVRGEAFYYSYIIVPRDSQAQSLEDLRGKTFAFSDPLSNSGRLAPVYMLWQLDQTPESFFKRYVFTYSHDNSIKAVAEKLVDGAAVDSLVYDYSIARYPQFSNQTKVIAKSPPFGVPPVVVNPALNQQLKMQLQGLLLNMHLDDEGKTILSGLMIDRFVTIDDASYDTIREMASKVRI